MEPSESGVEYERSWREVWMSVLHRLQLKMCPTLQRTVQATKARIVRMALLKSCLGLSKFIYEEQYNSISIGILALYNSPYF